jgi:hypothetical protein
LDAGAGSRIANLTIRNGNITACASVNGTGHGAGIGTAAAIDGGTSDIGTLSISNGNITAVAGLGQDRWGCGIGCGTDSVIHTLSLSGGRIRAEGDAGGIGSRGGTEPTGGEVEMLNFSGTGLAVCAAGPHGFPVDASSIAFSGASWVFLTTGDRLFGRAPSAQGRLSLAVLYGSVTAEGDEPLSLLHRPAIQIGNLTLPPGDSWTFCPGQPCKGGGNCFGGASFEVKALAVAVASPGECVLTARNGSVSGFLGTASDPSFVLLDSNVSFFSNAGFFPALPSGTCTPSQPFVPSFQPSRSGALPASLAFTASATFTMALRPLYRVRTRRLLDLGLFLFYAPPWA